MNNSERLKQYWADVRAGKREAPKRQRNGAVTRKTIVELDGSFGPDRGHAIIVTLHPDGRLELRPERTRRAEIVHLKDVYRWAIRCRVNHGQLEKARAAKEKRAIRLAAQRQARAEKRLLRPIE